MPVARTQTGLRNMQCGAEGHPRMKGTINRRDFSRAIAAGVGAAAFPATFPTMRAAAARNLKIGYTCITWGAFPRGAETSATLEAAVKDIASLGFYSFETFPE